MTVGARKIWTAGLIVVFVGFAAALLLAIGQPSAKANMTLVIAAAGFLLTTLKIVIDFAFGPIQARDTRRQQRVEAAAVMVREKLGGVRGSVLVDQLEKAWAQGDAKAVYKIASEISEIAEAVYMEAQVGHAIEILIGVIWIEASTLSDHDELDAIDSSTWSSSAARSSYDNVCEWFRKLESALHELLD